MKYKIMQTLAIAFVGFIIYKILNIFFFKEVSNFWHSIGCYIGKLYNILKANI